MRTFFLILLAAFIANPSAKAFSSEVGVAGFVATTNAGFDVKGEGAKVLGSEILKDKGKVSGNFTVNLRDLKTGMDLRDTHMCDTLECTKFPKAVFKLSPVEPSGKKAISGMLELHGVQKSFQGTAIFKSPTKALVTGKVNLKDFGITPPNYKLVRVEDFVEIQIEITNL